MTSLKTNDPAKMQDIFFIRTVMKMDKSKDDFSEEDRKDVDAIVNTALSFITGEEPLNYTAGYLQETVIDLLPENVRNKYADLFCRTVNTIEVETETVENSLTSATANLLFRNAKIHTYQTSTEECIDIFQKLVRSARNNLLEAMKQPDYWYGYGPFGGIMEDYDKVLELDTSSFKDDLTGYFEKVLEIVSDEEMLLTHLSFAIYKNNDSEEKPNRTSAKVFLRLILLTGSSDYYLNERFQFYRKR